MYGPSHILQDNTSPVVSGFALGITMLVYRVSLALNPFLNSRDTWATVGIDLIATLVDRSTTDLVAEPVSCISLFNIVYYSRPIKVIYTQTKNKPTSDVGAGGN